MLCASPNAEALALVEASRPATAKARTSHPRPMTLRPAELAARLGVTKRALYYWMRHPDPDVRLPPSFKLGRATVWRVEHVEEWLSRQERRRAPEPRA